MKTALWTLLLMGLFVPGRSNCQSYCNFCERMLKGVRNFETAGCLVECFHGFSGLNSRLCHPGIVNEIYRRRKRAEEKVQEAGSVMMLLLKKIDRRLLE